MPGPSQNKEGILVNVLDRIREADAPYRSLVTCQARREEFCLMTNVKGENTKFVVTGHLSKTSGVASVHVHKFISTVFSVSL
jgi:hypothetical protein